MAKVKARDEDAKFLTSPEGARTENSIIQAFTDAGYVLRVVDGDICQITVVTVDRIASGDTWVETDNIQGTYEGSSMLEALTLAYQGES